MGAPAPPRACLVFIRLLSVLVPPARRGDWAREWEAEVRHRWSRLSARGGVGWRDRLDLFRRVMGAMPDAAWLRRQLTLESEMLHDLFHGFRLLRRAPGFAASVVAILAVALGAAGAFLALADALVLRPLPYPEAERIVTLWQSNPRDRVEKDEVAPGNFLDLRERARSFEGLAAAIPYSYDWLEGREPEAWPAVQVTEGFFEAVGARPHLGRTFRLEEHVEGGPRVVILGHSLWRRRFDADPAVVGRTVRLDEGLFTVVGVMGPDFDLGLLPRRGGRGLWAPHVVRDHEKATRGSGWWNVVGRLRRGTSLAQARAELATLAGEFAAQHPRTNEDVTFPVVPLPDHLLATLRPALGALGGGIVLLLLLSWSNVAGLMAARSEARAREFALRASLGAGRARLVRQVLSENLLLVGLAGVAALALARLAVPLLLELSPVHVPRAETIVVGGRVAAGTALLAALSLVSCSLLPARRLLRPRLSGPGVARVLGGGPLGARRTLVVAQLSIALALLAASGLLVRTVATLLAVDPGFRKDHLLALQVFAWDRNPTPAQRRVFFEEAQRRMAAVPGVAAVGAVTAMPFTEDRIDIRSSIVVEGDPPPAPGLEPRLYLSVATPGYFEAMGVPLLRGRRFEARDAGSGPPVLLLNETLARRLFPGRDPVGRKVTVRWEGRPRVAEVVGVVGAVRQGSLERSAAPEAWMPHAQVPTASMTFVVRTTVDPAPLVRDVQRAVWSLDPQQTFTRVAVVEDLVERTIADRTFLSFVSRAFALVALGLAVVGTYGLLSFVVARRAGEIGLRMALGARPGDVLRLVMGEAGRLIAAGVGLGLAGALVVGRVLESLLFGIAPGDLPTLAAMTLAVAMAALFAAGAPAWRALRTDPVSSLRAE